MIYYWNTSKIKYNPGQTLEPCLIYLHSSSFMIKITAQHQKTRKNCPFILKIEKILSITYSREITVGFYHRIFVEILLGSIKQCPLFPSEVHMQILIGHCILKYSISVYYRNFGNDSIGYVFYNDIVFT